MHGKKKNVARATSMIGSVIMRGALAKNVGRVYALVNPGSKNDSHIPSDTKPYDKPTLMVRQAIYRLLAGEKMSFMPARQRWDYQYCGDAVDAFLGVAASCKGSQVYNLRSAQVRPLGEYIKTMGAIVGTGELGIGDVSYRGNEVMHLYVDVTKLRSATRWFPATTFEQGITLLASGVGGHPLDPSALWFCYRGFSINRYSCFACPSYKSQGTRRVMRYAS